jgi:hypothetical protein
MTTTPVPKWIKSCVTAAKAAVKNGSEHVLVVPVYEGIAHVLHYHKNRLVKDSYSAGQLKVLTDSGVPNKLTNGDYQNWGGHKPLDLFIHGVLVCKPDWRFIAIDAKRDDGSAYHNAALTLQLLHSRGFITPLSLMSWTEPEAVNNKSVAEHMETVVQRTALIRKELKRLSASWWLPKPYGLRVTDCSTFVPRKPKKLRGKSGSK